MKKQSHRGEEDTTPPSSTSSAWNDNDIDEETVGLLFNHSDSPTKGGSDHAGKYTAPAVTYHRTWIVLVVAVVFSLGFAGIILTNKTFHQAVDTPAGDYVEPSQVLQCPILTIDLREDDVDFGKYIHQGDKYGLRDKNATELWEWMQTSNVDGWGRSYHRE